MTQHRGRARRSFAVLVVTALTVIAACSTEDEPSEKPSTESASPEDAASASTSPSETVDPDEAAVLKAYKSAWDAQVDAYAKADSKGTDLHRHVTLDALGNMEGALRGMRKDGHIVTGQPKINPKVTSVMKGENPPTARITDCVDVGPWKLIDERTKKPVPLPPDRLTKHIEIVELQHWGKNGWMVTEVSPEGRKC